MRFRHPRVAIAFAIAGAIQLVLSLPALAQTGADAMESRDSTRASFGLRAQAIGLATHVDPGPADRSYTEGYLAQPLIMAHGGVRHLQGVLTLDFEGLTLERGQLNMGAYGEGYADRRHPHTYLHEAIAVASGAFGRVGVSLAGGKGFVPFGTDDPMTRPFAAYPVNHHLAQILERYVAIAAASAGPVTLEGAAFNGDEPTSPGAPPDASRFGDSWALRATVTPYSLVEIEGSFASVTSPEIASGGGRDQRKWSAAKPSMQSGAAMSSLQLTGQIGLRLDGESFIARQIELVTQSRAHHVVIAINETHVVSAEPGGAVIRPMTDYPWIVWSQFDYTDEQRQHMAVLAASMNRQEYNYLGFALIGFELITKTRVPDFVARAFSYQDRMFCSQMADFCLRKAGIDLFHSEWGMVSPGDFLLYFHQMGWFEPSKITLSI